MNVHEMLSAYTAEVLAWRLGHGAPAPPARENMEKAAATAARALRMAEKGGKSHVLLLGAGDGALAAMLAEGLPQTRELIVVESRVDLARLAAPAFIGRKGVALLADSSPYALHLLSLYAGIEPAQCAICRNPLLPGDDAAPLERWERLFLKGERLRLPHMAAQEAVEALGRISAACILHPDEKGLESFFGQFPAGLKEVAVIWDGRKPPQREFACAAPLRHFARPLGRDFAAQRNAMLERCTGDFCLYLDADERLKPEAWTALGRLCALPGFGGALFPRLTFEGDESHVRMGYGLWPDLQLRLFSLRGAPAFQGAVHERLEGLAGGLHLAPATEIMHYSHVRKSSGELRARLGVFNEAAGAQAHRLNAAYPRMPLEFFTMAARGFGSDAVVKMPA